MTGGWQPYGCTVGPSLVQSRSLCTFVIESQFIPNSFFRIERMALLSSWEGRILYAMTLFPLFSLSFSSRTVQRTSKFNVCLELSHREETLLCTTCQASPACHLLARDDSTTLNFSRRAVISILRRSADYAMDWFILWYRVVSAFPTIDVILAAEASWCEALWGHTLHAGHTHLRLIFSTILSCLEVVSFRQVAQNHHSLLLMNSHLSLQCR